MSGFRALLAEVGCQAGQHEVLADTLAKVGLCCHDAADGGDGNGAADGGGGGCGDGDGCRPGVAPGDGGAKQGGGEIDQGERERGAETR